MIKSTSIDDLFIVGYLRMNVQFFFINISVAFISIYIYFHNTNYKFILRFAYRTRRHQHYKRRKSSIQDGHQTWRRQNELSLLAAPGGTGFSIGGGPIGGSSTNRRVSVQPEDAGLEVSGLL